MTVSACVLCATCGDVALRLDNWSRGRYKISSAKTGYSARMTASPPSPDARGKVLRLHGTIARKLGIAIVSGQYRPGDLLDGEIASSEQLSVSRTAYREAVRILAAKGLVDARPKVGTRINPQTKWNLLDPDVLDWTFESEPDMELLNSLFELRNVVESAAAGSRRDTPLRRASQGHAFRARRHVQAYIGDRGRSSGRSRFPCHASRRDQQPLHHFAHKRRQCRDQHHHDVQTAQTSACDATRCRTI